VHERLRLQCATTNFNYGTSNSGSNYGTSNSGFSNSGSYPGIKLMHGIQSQ
jgi:hypothetical protein